MSERNFDEIFPKSPLKEVAFEIRFPVNLSIEGEIYKFQEKIKKELPVFREGEILGTKLIFREFEKSNEIKLRVLRNSFIVMTEKYNSFKNFSPLIKKFTNIFISTYNIGEINRIGLRYINNIQLGEKPSDFLKQYFVQIFDDKIISVESIENFMTEICMKRNSHFITNRSGIIVSPKKETIYVLDFDAFYQKNTPKENVYDILELLHKDIIKEFHSNINDEYLDLMRG